MNLKEKYNLIKEYKFQNNPDNDNSVQKYLKAQIKDVFDNRKSFSINNLDRAKEEFSKPGVYLFFLIVEGKVLFTYVGESCNMAIRFQQHRECILKSKKMLYLRIRKIIKHNDDFFNKIVFMPLEWNGLDNDNKRFYRETFNIFKFKTKKYALNRSNQSKKMMCHHGIHGKCRTGLKLKNINGEQKIILFGKSINKKCKGDFIIE